MDIQHDHSGSLLLSTSCWMLSGPSLAQNQSPSYL